MFLHLKSCRQTKFELALLAPQAPIRTQQSSAGRALRASAERMRPPYSEFRLEKQAVFTQDAAQFESFEAPLARRSDIAAVVRVLACACPA
jgi:hypothetical protein